MAGRAGRAGLDNQGETVLLAHKDVPLAHLQRLLTADPEPVTSCLTEDKKGGRELLLQPPVLPCLFGVGLQGHSWRGL